jgi:hypothetical protein
MNTIVASRTPALANLILAVDLGKYKSSPASTT